MKSLVIYDSFFGNTQQVAEAIAAGLGADAVKVSSLHAGESRNYDLLVVGTPIMGWKPTVSMQAFLGELPSLKGIKATAFDTRVRLFVHGDAMAKVADALRGAGAEIIVPPVPFYVAGPRQNPHLLDGELEKATEWGKEIKTKCP
jgi:flavodoxin